MVFSMIDYLNITQSEQEMHMKMFSEWVDWFICQADLSDDDAVFEDYEGTVFNVKNYVDDLKQTFVLQDASKRRMSFAYLHGGKSSLLRYMTGTAPLILKECVL